MMCPDCGAKMGIEKTANFARFTLRLEQCPCGVRVETETKVIRRLPATANSQPATVGVSKSTAKPAVKPPPATAGTPPATAGGAGGALSGDLLPISVSSGPIGSPSGSDQGVDRVRGKLAQKMLATFCEEWKRSYGENYLVTPKDAGQVRALLERSPGAQDGWREACGRYVDGKTPFFVEARHPLALLVGSLNEFTGPAKTVRKGPTSGNLDVLRDFMAKGG